MEEPTKISCYIYIEREEWCWFGQPVNLWNSQHPLLKLCASFAAVSSIITCSCVQSCGIPSADFLHSRLLSYCPGFVKISASSSSSLLKRVHGKDAGTFPKYPVFNHVIFCGGMQWFSLCWFLFVFVLFCLYGFQWKTMNISCFTRCSWSLCLYVKK